MTTHNGMGGCRSPEEHNNRLLQKSLSAIRYKIFILSGKGGVGKSTVAVNLAVALSTRGYETGILDIDIHGPNVAKMLGVDGTALSTNDTGDKILPLQVFPYLKAVSTAGLLPDSDTPVVWRGPRKIDIIRQFIEDVAWGKLDFLIVDSPPGTGDEPISISSLIPDADGAIIVTSPQEVALLDSRKCVNFAKQINLPVLGIIENMSGMHCPHCHKPIPLFGQGGGQKAAADLSVPLLGILPIAPDLPLRCDKGQPHVLTDDNSEFKRTFNEIVGRLIATLEK